MADFTDPLVHWFLANLPWIVLAIVMHLTVLGTVSFMILGERKVAAWAQDRVGPNRAGMGFGIVPILKDYSLLGLGQSFADGIKMFTKEDYRAPAADRNLFTLAPMIMMAVVVISIAVIPWGGTYGRSQELLVNGANSIQIVPLIEKQLSGANTLQGPVVVKTTVDGHAVVGKLDDAGRIIRDDTHAPLDPTAAAVVKATYTEGWRFQIASLNVGVIYVLAVLGLAVYGVVIGGYASNNKYSFLGGLRATANMISYEIPLGISILCIALMFGTFDLHQIVNLQATYWLGFIPAWNVFAHPLTFILFLICIHAEANRAPFDTAECEQELVGGYHTEYSSMRFGMFFLAEYAGIITTSAICVALFFGGWHIPWLEYLWPAGLKGVGSEHAVDSLLGGIIRIAAFFTKTMGIVFIFMWVRWSVPRFRFDQIMSLAWKTLIPVSLGLLVTTAIGVYLCGGSTVDGLSFGAAILFLIMNVVVAAITLLIGAAMKVGTLNPNHRIVVPGSRYATNLATDAALRGAPMVS